MRRCILTACNLLPWLLVLAAISDAKLARKYREPSAGLVEKLAMKRTLTIDDETVILLDGKRVDYETFAKAENVEITEMVTREAYIVKLVGVTVKPKKSKP